MIQYNHVLKMPFFSVGTGNNPSILLQVIKNRVAFIPIM